MPSAGPDTRVIAGGGTFTANPMTAVAGLATFDVIEAEPVYDETEAMGARVRNGLTKIFEEEGVSGVALGFSSLIQPVFNPDRSLESPTDVKTGTDAAAVKAFHSHLADHGYYFNQGSMGNISYPTTEEHIDGLLEAARTAVRAMKESGIV